MLMTPTTLELIIDPEGDALNAVLRQGYRQTTSWGALYFLNPGTTPDAEALCALVAPVLSDMPARVYQLGNGDTIITWKGAQKATLDQLCKRIYPAFAPEGDEIRHRHYDMQAQGDALRLFFTGRLEHSARKEKEAAPPPAPTPSAGISDQQTDQFMRAMHGRATRSSPHTLVLTDQFYTGKLITSLIGIKYKTYLADGPKEGFELFTKHAPDIVILDYELAASDTDRTIAEIRRIDPHVFIVLVAMGHDVQASERKADAFLVKPFTTAKLHALIERFPARR